jgi:hypothetical protein
MIARKTLIPGSLDTNDKILSAILGTLPVELPPSAFRDLVRSNRWRTVKLKASHNPKHRRSFLQRFGMSKLGMKTFEAEAGPLELFVDLLTQLLQFDPALRFGATEALNHPFFGAYKARIETTRALYRPSPIPDQKIIVRDCMERRWMAQIATQIFNMRSGLEWYTTRILFQAMDLFDRYLNVMFHYNQIRPNALESESRGLIHDRFETDLRFQTCIYICIKYFSSLHYPIPFTAVAPEEYHTEQALAMVEQFEGGLIINCLEYDVYRGTVYEAADVFKDELDDINIRDLIILYSRNSSLSGWTPAQIYAYYRAHLRGADMAALLEPFPSTAPPPKIPPPPAKRPSGVPPPGVSFKIPPPPPRRA